MLNGRAEPMNGFMETVSPCDSNQDVAFAHPERSFSITEQ
jgi:hypothetical protein